MAKDGSETDIIVSPGVATEGRIDHHFEILDKQYDVYFSCDKVELSGDISAATLMAMMGAMKNELNIRAQGSLSPLFIENQYKLMDKFISWFPNYKKVEIQCDTVSEEVPQPPKNKTGRIGSFFTGGVDSFYSFLKHKPEITDLIYVHGYDIKLSDLARRKAISKMGAEISKEAGVRFVEIETNCIRLFKDYGRWGAHGHGLGLGSVARQLSNYLDKIYIPSSFATNELIPWASHPELDPLYTDESLEVIHDGCESSRTEKIRAIADNSLVYRYLRVCSEGVGAHNCGSCEKCIRTMTGFLAVGTLKVCETFPREIDTKKMLPIVISSPSETAFALDNIENLTQAGMSEHEVCKAWQTIADRSPLKNKAILRGRRIKKQFRHAMDKLRRIKK